MAIAKRHLRWLINLWPPFLGAGIRVTQPDWKAIDVEMKLRFWNSNYVGTHFGGSLYAMTDPFYMLMLIENPGQDDIVWDKYASVRSDNRERARCSLPFACPASRSKNFAGNWKRNRRSSPLSPWTSRMKPEL